MAKREATFEQVRDGIVAALRRAYPNPKVHIRSERTHQNAENGDFNIILISPRTLTSMMDVWQNSVTFDVVYYADRDTSVIDDMMRVATDLPLLLETITTPSGVKLHPANKPEPTPQDDDTLHTIVRYDYHVIAKRVHVDEFGNEIPYKADGTLDDTDLMRRLDLHFPEKENDDGES